MILLVVESNGAAVVVADVVDVDVADVDVKTLKLFPN